MHNSLNKFNQVVKAIQDGNKVTCYGDNVSLEGNYSWQDKKLWINFKNGAAVSASYNDVISMKIHPKESIEIKS